MKSTSKSVGKICLALLATSLWGCQSSEKSAEGPLMVEKAEKELSSEISLKADRDSLGELRAAIPQERQQSNDELALMLQLMNEVKLSPSEVQSKYQALVQKRRTSFRDKVTRLREEYKKRETKSRQEFVKKQEEARKEFKTRKADREESKEFYAEQERNRQDHFSRERDQRKEFESEVAAQSKDFDSYMRERQKEFSEQMRLYSKRYYDAQREKSKAGTAASGSISSSNDEVKALKKELEEMSKKEGTPLKAE